MKTVQISIEAMCDDFRQGSEIRRVSDDEARRLVSTGKYVYVPKSLWKSEVRDKLTS